MKIEKHGNKYRVRKMYKGKTYTVDFNHEPTDKEVTIALAQKLAEGSTIKSGSFEEYANLYMTNRDNVTSPNTLRTYNTKLNQLSDKFKSKNIQNITGDDVQAEINLLAKTYEPKTVATTHGFISSVLREYRPYLRLNTKLPQAIKKEKYTPSNEDIKRILNEVEGTRYEIPFTLGVWGCRVGEICSLTIEDLKGNDLYIHRNLALDTGNSWVLKENPKTDESNRILPLSEDLAEKIREQGYIYDGHPNALNKAIHRIQKRLDIQPFPFHALRHYFASYAHSIGIPDADIMSIGGWKTDHVMKRVYRETIEESKRKSLVKLTTGLFGNAE